MTNQSSSPYSKLNMRTIINIVCSLLVWLPFLGRFCIWDRGNRSVSSAPFHTFSLHSICFSKGCMHCNFRGGLFCPLEVYFLLYLLALCITCYFWHHPAPPPSLGFSHRCLQSLFNSFFFPLMDWVSTGQALLDTVVHDVSLCFYNEPFPNLINIPIASLCSLLFPTVFSPMS